MTHRSQDHTTHGTATHVQRRIHLDLVVAGDRLADLTAGFRYETSDPYAVTLTFHGEGPDVVWSFARDLLARGLTEPIGEGDVQVRPAVGIGGRPVTVLELHSPDGHAHLEADHADVADFVADSLALVPAGLEGTHVDLDTLVADLLAV